MQNIQAAINTPVPSNNGALFSVVLNSDDLPTLPTIASKLLSLTSREDATLSDIADLIVQDIALSSKILKVANSAFYSFPQQIDSIPQAVSLLGTNAVKSLVLSFSFMSINKGGLDNQFNFQKFWERSFAAAIIAKLILGKVPGGDEEEVFLPALLQNLGQLILACTLPEEYGSVLSQVDENPDLSSLDVEKSVFGADHCLIGYEVAKHWGFPLSIALPILHHHDPMGYAGNEGKINMATRAIYLSDILLKIFYSDKPEDYYCQFQTEAAQLFMLKPMCIEAIMEGAHLQLEQSAATFGLKLDKTRPVSEILQEANIRLSLLNLDYDQINKELIKAKLSLEKITIDLQEKNKLLKDLADVDGLTGIYNNRYFQGALDKELSRSIRNKKALSLIFVDIDHFKRFNDDYGHLVGDFVLTEFCRVMKENLREYDVLARYGGEEFVIILPETNEGDAFFVAEKLRSIVEGQAFAEDGEKYHVTASFGIASIENYADYLPDKTELIRMADEAVYDAKKRGRNQVAVYAIKKKWYKLA